MNTVYEMQIALEDGEGNYTRWASIRATGAKTPYRYRTQDEANRMLRTCYPDLCRDYRLGISQRVRIKPVEVPDAVFSAMFPDHPAKESLHE